MSPISAIRRGAVLLVGLALAAGAAGQSFPTKTVSLMVPYPAGGASDYLARQVQADYQKHLGQPVIVDNLGGVSGALGTQKVLSALPDGHSQVLVTPIEAMLAPFSLSAVKYKPEDLRLASLIATTPIVLLARKDIPASNLDEFLTWAKGKDVSYGSVGPGSLYHILGEKMATRAGLKMTHVPYKGGTQLITDIGGGQIDVAFFALAGPVPGMINGQRVRAIAVTSGKALPTWPAIKPFAQTKRFEDFVLDIWAGVAVPRSTPDEAVARINRAIEETLKNPAIRKNIEDAGSTVAKPMSTLELNDFYASQVTEYRKLFKSINFQPQ
ncbi:tripartite tricarboxylate transporter substrate binding protein [Variovorax sp. J22R115]|uniref:tripartite tricarboxylate transporter substrate binding protein n=1 Tax=Variovorax sp. J22R115 TaxID=3053509 RepID=UPI0025783B11|nr:tripartite tricarboxylate transporter substrate binding protein [Variovorax sp. J22R115]MDM0047390.1 tripartite tricarboxylate transporter substrate binding protein [Variovorax sp. J22R115]